jgi:hypothetical protein
MACYYDENHGTCNLPSGVCCSDLEYMNCPMLPEGETNDVEGRNHQDTEGCMI